MTVPTLAIKTALGVMRGSPNLGNTATTSVVDTGVRDVSAAEALRVKDLGRENKELRWANEIFGI